MADLYVLEGDRGEFQRLKRHAPARRHMRQVDGIVYGNPMDALLGRSFLKKIGGAVKSVAKVAAAPVTMTYSVTKSAAKATVQAVKKPTFSNIAKIVTKPVVRAGNETKSVAREAGHAVMETGRAAGTALDVTRRVAKRIIKSVAKKVLFKGDMLLGESLSAIPKNAAKGVLMPVATAAVLANTVTAPAAPAVPILVNEVIDELYSAIEKKVKQGLSPERAAQEAKADLDKMEPGEENDPKVSSGYTPWLIGGGLALLAFIAIRRRNS